MSRLSALAAATALTVGGPFWLAGCSNGDGDGTASTSVPGPAGHSDDRFPTIVDAEATRDATTGTWAFSVTVSSPYDSPDRYADGWRVLGSDGTVFGVHTLTHDHADEQPFTRRQTGVDIPSDVDEVTIEGRDLVNGFGGPTVTVELDGDN